MNGCFTRSADGTIANMGRWMAALIAVLVGCVLVLAAAPNSAWAGDGLDNPGPHLRAAVGGGTVTLDIYVEDGYTGSDTDMEDKVVADNYPWYSWRKDIEVVKIGEGVTSIGERAFEGYPALEKVIIPASVKHVGFRAFSNCENLKTVVFKGASTELDDAVFIESENSDLVITGYAVENAPEGSVPAYCYDEEIRFNAVNGDLGSYTLDVSSGKKVFSKAENRNEYFGVGGLLWVLDDSNRIWWTIEAGICELDNSTDGSGDLAYSSGDGKATFAAISTNSVRGSKTFKLTDYERTVAAMYNPDGFYYSSITFRMSAIPLSSCTVGAIAAQAYTGKALTPAVTVKDGAKVLAVGVDYKVSYSANKKIGTAKAIITGTGDYKGSVTKTFKIKKGKATAKAKKAMVAIAAAKLKKKAQTIANLDVKCDKGKARYKNASSGAAKKFKVNKKNGKLTVPKGTAKGTYKVKVKVTVKAGKNYKKLTKTVAFKVKVSKAASTAGAGHLHAA